MADKNMNEEQNGSSNEESNSDSKVYRNIQDFCKGFGEGMMDVAKSPGTLAQVVVGLFLPVPWDNNN